MFIVEMMFAKMVLPRLGGSPSVWNTCLVFYQAVLMAGYIYAHVSLKWLGPRRQSVLHIVLLSLAWLSLPIAVAKGWTPPTEGNPALWLLLLLTVCVGLPFLCISASAPVLQSWFAFCGGRSAKDPYFLYAASNLGSLAGLAAYPALDRAPPAACLAIAVLVCRLRTADGPVWTVRNRGVDGRNASGCGPESAAPPASGDAARAEEDASLPDGFRAPLTLRRRLWWLALAVVPWRMLMGVTSHLSQDIAPIPLLWAIPLGFYLLSFIVVFAAGRS